MPRSDYNRKAIKDGGVPCRRIREGGTPDRVMERKPSWCISLCDTSPNCSWAFSKERLVDDLWNKIFPKLKAFESMTWAEIFIGAKKQNHTIPCSKLNKSAQDRLIELQIDTDMIYSLRLSGNIRIYGLLVESAFCILWYDDDHGDNRSCVCRSVLKHT